MQLPGAGVPFKIVRPWSMVHTTKRGPSKKLDVSWEGLYVAIKKITDVVHQKAHYYIILPLLI